MLELIAAVVLLQALDGWTTYRIISRGVGYERNPVIQWLIDRLGLYGGLFAGKGAVAALVALGAPLGWWDGEIELYLLFGLAGLYSFVVVNNYRILR